jgi:NADH:ubiquinone oxidoreductase subunit
MSYANVFRAVKEWGVKGTFWRLFQQRTLKFGTLMGVDKYGNEYYENTEYPHPQHRWVVFAGNPSFYDSDPSAVPAEWHLWLHNTTDDVPTETTTGSTYKEMPPELVTGAHDHYERNLGGVVSQHTPNLSHHRSRGYGLGNGLHGPAVASKWGEEKYYTQPGHPLDKRTPRGRKARPWSLRDTATSLAAKEHADLAQFGYGAAGATEGAVLLQEGGAGTFAGGADLELTAEEEAYLASSGGVTAGDEEELEALQEKVAVLTNVIAEYRATGAPEVVKEGLAMAEEELAGAERALRMKLTIDAKVKKAGLV